MLQGEESVAKLENGSSGTKKIGEVFDAERVFFCEKWAYFLCTKINIQKHGAVSHQNFALGQNPKNMQQLQNI